MGTEASGEWERLTEDGAVRIKKTLIKEESGSPAYGDEVKVHYYGYLQGKSKEESFDNSYSRGQPLSFVMGEGMVISGWEIGVGQMRLGEKAVLEMGPDYAYGDTGHPPAIPGGSTLVFEVELVSFAAKKKEAHELSQSEKENESMKYKELGVDLYKKGEYKKALDEFQQAIYYCDLPSYKRDSKPLPAKLSEVYLSSHLNSSLCALQEKDWPGANGYATQVLKVLPTTEVKSRAKASFRRGIARSHMGLLDEAKSDLLLAAKLEPKNRSIRLELERVKKLIKTQNQAQQSVFAKAFDRVDLFPDKPQNVNNPSTTDNPYAFLHFSAAIDNDTKIDGMVIVRVFADACPRTARNFLALCTGERGISKISAKRLHYKNCLVTRVIADFCIQTGDFVCGDGTSGESIYGRFFDDEHFKILHDRPGVIAMANKGPNTNASQFFITLDEAHHCDNNDVAFGHVVFGLDIIRSIAKLPCLPDTQRPAKEVRIIDCGLLSKEDAEARIAQEQEALAARPVEDTAADSSVNDTESSHPNQGAVVDELPPAPPSTKDDKPAAA